MKKISPNICAILLLVTVALSFGVFPVAHATESTAQDKALAFIENALPIDLTSVSPSKYAAVSPIKPEIATQELVTYTLEDAENKIDVICVIENNAVTGCVLYTFNDSISSTPQIGNVIDSAKRFLEKYQTYTEDDLTEMINLLPMIDATKNMTVASQGNVKLTVTNMEFDTIFSWTYTVNGADYTSIKVTYRNGAFYALRDDRSLYTIGNTDVNISKEQATNTALKHIQSYSYTGVTSSGDKETYVQISGFNVTESSIVAELCTYPKDSSTLYPYWRIQLPLTEFYPGGVWALLVGVWADSGDVFLCQPLAVGGGQNDELPIAPTESTSLQPALQQEPSNPLPTSGYLTIMTVAVIAIIAITTVVLKKRRK